MPSVSQPLGTLGLSEDLRTFVQEAPHERRSILDFLMQASDRLPPGSRVADVGAGDAPYRELFDHCEYVTIDWELSPHEGARNVDVTAPADAIPIPEQSFDVVLLTQVLEHVPEPPRVLGELYRILRPEGVLYLTAPLVWELHEMPFDYFRYTQPGLDHLLREAGFDHVEVTARNDCFTTLAQLMRNARHVMGRAPDGLDDLRESVAAELDRLAGEVAAFAPLDVSRIFPLGYAASAVRPAEPDNGAAPAPR